MGNLLKEAIKAEAKMVEERNMEAEATPGPWGISNHLIFDPQGLTVAEVYEDGINWGTPLETAQAKATARLIAAAPTMRQKLADTVAWLNREIKTVAWADMKESTLLIERLTELRDDLLETLRKIEEGA